MVDIRHLSGNPDQKDVHYSTYDRSHESGHQVFLLPFPIPGGTENVEEEVTSEYSSEMKLLPFRKCPHYKDHRKRPPDWVAA
jgi:hypothetical protein